MNDLRRAAVPFCVFCFAFSPAILFRPYPVLQWRFQVPCVPHRRDSDAFDSIACLTWCLGMRLVCQGVGAIPAAECIFRWRVLNVCTWAYFSRQRLAGLASEILTVGACSLRGVLRQALLLAVCREQSQWWLRYSLCGCGRPRAPYRESGHRARSLHDYASYLVGLSLKARPPKPISS